MFLTFRVDVGYLPYYVTQPTHCSRRRKA